MHVRLTSDAVSDLNAIKEYLDPRNPRACDRILAAIFATLGQLESFPLLGKYGRVSGTREITVPRTPFFVVYSLPDQIHIDIDRILHGRQQYPPVTE